MEMNSTRKTQAFLLLVDILVLAVVTVSGFASHGTAGTAGMRMLTTFLPLVAAWCLVAPHLGVFDPARVVDARQLWRPFWAMVLAGPMAAFLRGAWLGAPILPLFVVVLGGFSALGLLAWRTIYLLVARRKT
jgi:asparagine N-glycosylation enzyme membrane subunit Stt3